MRQATLANPAARSAVRVLRVDQNSQVNQVTK